MALKPVVGKIQIKKTEFSFLFFGWQSIASAGGFDKHRIKRPRPNVNKSNTKEIYSLDPGSWIV